MASACPERAYILCPVARRSNIYASWLDQVGLPVEVPDEYGPDWTPPDGAAIVISHLHYTWDEVHLLRGAVEARRIPVLILADGILEYRNTWHNSRISAASVFQPVMGHKLACIGRSQARFVESWGNVGKCEVVGLPRLDATWNSPPPARRDSGPFRLLVATARTPYFDEAQRRVTLESLRALRERLSQRTEVGQRPLEVAWRVARNLAEELGLPEEPAATGPRLALAEAIDWADAVITTPSTLQLDAALRRRPVAVLDFHHYPQYVPAAWTISAPDQIDGVTIELANPPAARMLFQDAVLDDTLEHRTPATPRLLRLIETMVQCGRECRQAGVPLNLPHRILDDPQHGMAMVPETFDLARLYPDNRVFAESDRRALQAELAGLIEEVRQFRGLQEKSGATVESIRRRLQAAHRKLAARNQRISQLRRRVQRLVQAKARQSLPPTSPPPEPTA
jgi:hypothetical protein